MATGQATRKLVEGSGRAAHAGDGGGNREGDGSGGFVAQVRDALAHLHDLPYLQRHPLAAGVQAPPGPDGPRGPPVQAARRLQQALLAAIGVLRPGDGWVPGHDSRVAARHDLLLLRYVEALPVAEVQRRLVISRSEYFRLHRRALVGVSSVLREQWALATPDEGHTGDVLARSGPAAAPAGNLGPPQLTSFVGREQETTAVMGLLCETRLLTLTGSGGCGKTRLALHVATSLRDAPDAADHYPDGVWLVELAALADPKLVPQTVAAALRIQAERGQPMLATLLGALRDKRLLLLLDNCEHVVGAVAQVAQAVLEGCLGVRILATSREPLRVAGETSWRVPSLAAPDPLRLPPLPDLGEIAAVRLFVDRACAVQPGFALSAENAAAVAGVCFRLDGIPLAIELAATRVPSLGVVTLARRLDERFQLLAGGARTALPRQQTLRAAVDWSYALLDKPEQRLFNRLSVFAGGFSLEAAEAVCNTPVDAVLAVLPRLVDKSLVQADSQGQADGMVRYRLLQTLRRYAAERLAAAREALDFQERHAAYFGSLAGNGTPSDGYAPGMSCWHVPAAEDDNFRQALRWYAQQARGGDSQAALRGLELATAVSFSWHQRGWLEEAFTWLDTLLAMPATAARTRGRAYAVLAWVFARAWVGLEVDGTVVAWLEESLAIAREHGDRAAERQALYSLGIWLIDRGPASDLVAARRWLEACLALARHSGAAAGPAGAAMCLYNLGDLARLEGDIAGAQRLQEQAVAMLQPAGDNRTLAYALIHLSETVEAQGTLARACELAEQALSLLQLIDDQSRFASALVQLARLRSALGDLATARRHLEESMVIRRVTGSRRGTLEALCQLAEVAVRQDDPAGALAALDEALALAHDLGHADVVLAVQADLDALSQPSGGYTVGVPSPPDSAGWASSGPGHGGEV